MPATTAARLADGALRKLGLLSGAKVPNGNDVSFCLNALNTMADAMQLEPGFATQLRETVHTVANGTVSATLGPGMDIDIPRPSYISDASYIRSAGIDHPLAIFDTRKWAGIDQKTLGGSWPQVLWFDGGQPTGNLYFWPQGGGELHLFTPLQAGSSFADSTTLYDLPAGFERMFIYNLAVEVAPDFEAVARADVVTTAQNTRRAVKLANLTIPELNVPLGNGRGWYTQADFLAGR